VLLRVPLNSARYGARFIRSACCRATTCIITVAFAAQEAHANDWKIEPSISAYESFTSNAGLDPPGKEKADFVTTVSPAIDVDRKGPRLNFDLNYNLDAILYAREHDQDEVQQRLRFDTRAVVLPELFFLDANAAISQQPKQSERPSSGSQLTASTNEESVYTYRISPSLHNHLGNFADSSVRYTFGQVFANGLSNTTIQRLDSSLTSGRQFPRLIWALTENAAYSSGSRNVSDIFAAASAEYHIDRTMSLVGSAGYERISDSTLDDEPDGPIGTAGVRLTPGPRTSLDVLYNHRFGSNFVTGNLSYLIDTQSRLDASYTERVETSQLAFVDNLDFLQRDETGAFIDSRTERLFRLDDSSFGLEDNAFRLRAFNLSLHLVRGRNTWDAVAYHERRTIDALDERDTAFGGSLNWAHQLNEVASLNLTARYRYETFDGPFGGDHVQLVGAGAALVNNLADNLDAVIAVNFTKQFADKSDNEFVETVVSLGLIKRF
jgi:uncharacterized protein (PEP-CTERM system associated)